MPLKLFESKKQFPRTVGIAAGKGGVGKSTLTVNLALALRTHGFKVGILDADLYGPSIRAMLPESTPPGQKNGRFLPAISNGIAIISMAFFKPKEKASLIRAPIASQLIGQFLHQVDWGELDYLLIDFPPGTGDIQITLSQKASLTAALIVTTPQEIALLDVRKCMEMFNQVHIPIAGIVENMSHYEVEGTKEKIPLFGTGGGKNLAKESGIPLLGQIPIHPLIGDCLDSGMSLFQINEPNSINLKNCFSSISLTLHEELNWLEKASKNFCPFEIFWRKIAEPLVKPEPILKEKSDKVTILSLQQISNTEFIIEWTDGNITSYSLSNLQKQCPCAGCHKQKQTVDPNVQAVKIKSVGRYAIQIDFSSGCSRGIYDFNMLYNINFEATPCV